MSKEKPILQMLRDGYSQRHIASFLHVSRNTVARVAKAASEHQLPNDVLESMDEVEIRHTLFPEEALIPTLVTPDFPYIHKELLKNGVTLKLLWQEYVDTCRNTGKPPYGYSQYCKLYQDYVTQHKLTIVFWRAIFPIFIVMFPKISVVYSCSFKEYQYISEKSRTHSRRYRG